MKTASHPIPMAPSSSASVCSRPPACCPVVSQPTRERTSNHRAKGRTVAMPSWPEVPVQKSSSGTLVTCRVEPSRMDAPEATHPDARLYVEALSRGLDYGQRRDGADDLCLPVELLATAVELAPASALVAPGLAYDRPHGYDERRKAAKITRSSAPDSSAWRTGRAKFTRATSATAHKRGSSRRSRRPITSSKNSTVIAPGRWTSSRKPTPISPAPSSPCNAIASP